eukprot:CAMPEP_0175135616 /NCGR_PEP_ID=MMETSP0087-20121206/8833_1 /TAXON_ID=136419 /ORGANISM="Unknown Unknown, Strain D1" /LENGTH=397 /DNA_ID=CAMNT_0016418309 /DNA_START=135 /DNA_END=1328 /DNA_ORIENTATION=-
MSEDCKSEYGLLEEVDACIGVRNGKISYVGSRAKLSSKAVPPPEGIVDLEGGLVTPGLIDCHSHILYGGNRSTEWALKLKGASYEEVAKAGGGIVNTVDGTRKVTADELVQLATPRIKALLREGVTTMELKSGYGLDEATERKQLQAANKVGEDFDLNVVKTFLGAHAIPREFSGRTDDYVSTVVEMMPKLAEEGLIDCVDAFMESIAFNEQQTARVFDAATKLGIRVRLHGDQLNNLECGAFVAKYKGLSCDHCEYTSEASVKAMAASDSVAVLLPTANYFIRETKMPPVEAFRSAGVKMALGTNCNPGSSPCCSILLVLNMACTRFRMTPEEALLGVTRNAAHALGKGESLGTIEVGKQADLAVWSCTNPCDLAYYLGLNQLKAAYVAGKQRFVD